MPVNTVFNRTEISFLGHVITEKGVSICPKTKVFILIYPSPKNQKLLRPFLGVFNYHHRFIIGFANFIAPLLALLKKKERNGSGLQSCRVSWKP